MNNCCIIGCGAIALRHIEAISSNNNFNLYSVFDIDKSLGDFYAQKYNCISYPDIDSLLSDQDLNFVSICTPNHLHYDQAVLCLKNKKNVLIEKPASFSSESIKKLNLISKECNQKCYCVLQVRLNNTISLTKEVLDANILGKIRSVSLVQRWQRPIEYFSGWRASPKLGGGILYEVGIHYLDVLQYLFGKPKVCSSKEYSTKHTHCSIEDTVYSIFDFGSYGGTCEVTIASEPRNLECSISIQGSNGFLKIGGKALNVIESANFLSQKSQNLYSDMYSKYNINTTPNSYGSYEGSCPNHAKLYSNLNKFDITESFNVIKLIEDIYKLSNIEYT